MTPRILITEDQVKHGIKRLQYTLNLRLIEKGRGTLASRHEILGVLEEEMQELRAAVAGKPGDKVADELMDVAVGALFGWICMFNKTTDW